MMYIKYAYIYIYIYTPSLDKPSSRCRSQSIHGALPKSDLAGPPNPKCFTSLPIVTTGYSSCVANVFDQDLRSVNAETKTHKNLRENLMQRKT